MTRRATGGFTLVEALLATAMVAAIFWALAVMFQAVAVSWAGQGARVGLGLNAGRAVAAVTRDLRGAMDVLGQTENEIRFSPDKTNYFAYYLYGPLSGGLYQLRRATVSGGAAGTYNAGSGDIVAKNILRPASILSVNGGLVTIDLTEQQTNCSIRRAGMVRPRNM